MRIALGNHVIRSGRRLIEKSSDKQGAHHGSRDEQNKRQYGKNNLDDRLFRLSFDFFGGCCCIRHGVPLSLASISIVLRDWLRPARSILWLRSIRLSPALQRFSQAPFCELLLPAHP